MENKYLPNQSGTFGNKVNFHDIETEQKIFVVEFHTDDLQERAKIVSLIRAQTDMLEALQNLTAQFERVTPLYTSDQRLIDAANLAINKALTI